MDYQKGDTVRLSAAFYNFADELADCDGNVTVTVYDHTGAQIATGVATRSSTGAYYYDYTTTDEGMFTYEFSGMSGGTAVVRRSVISVVFD
jgi:uncharacterized protein YfaS (alpha-2-macroglobulin family)